MCFIICLGTLHPTSKPVRNVQYWGQIGLREERDFIHSEHSSDARVFGLRLSDGSEHTKMAGSCQMTTLGHVIKREKQL